MEKIYMSNTMLCEGVKKRSYIAFEYIYKYYYPELHRFAAHILLSSDEADDVIQDIFENLWLRADSLGVNTNIRAYLYTSARNNCYNRIKHLKIQDTNNLQLLEALTFAYGDSVDEVEHEEYLSIKVKKGIEALPYKQRQIIVLKYDGLSYEEIGDLLEISIETVRSHVKKSYKILREYFSIYK